MTEKEIKLAWEEFYKQEPIPNIPSFNPQYEPLEIDSINKVNTPPDYRLGEK